MIRWRAFCSYDGTDFTGWQSQADGSAVQDAVEKAIAGVLGEKVRLHGASRTDAGVHARAQGIHFDCDWKHPPEALLRAVQTHLPRTIRIHGLKRAENDFHARFSALGKRSHYYFSTAPPTPFTVRYRWHLPFREFDPERIRSVLPALGGTHDFRAFAGKVAEAETPEKTLREPVLLQEGERDWCLRVEGDGFLYRMVRCLAGTLVRVAAGKLAPERIPALLEEGRRTPEVLTAPPGGLFLEEVFYPPENAGTASEPHAP